jgi:predicted lactoylglutathione lyase
MAKQIFVNLPVKDLNKSIEFFKKLEFEFNTQFTDDKAACMIIADNIFAMLLLEKYFRTFTKKDIVDAKTGTEVLIALDAESREKVDELIKKALNAGGSLYAEPQDHGWMYGHSFADLDGHQWEILYMDEDALKQSQTELAEEKK